MMIDFDGIEFALVRKGRVLGIDDCLETIRAINDGARKDESHTTEEQMVFDTIIERLHGLKPAS